MRTIKLIHAVLHQALKRALDLGLIVRNPADIVKAPKYQPGEMRVFDESQINRMLFAVRGDRNEALFVFAVTTGCRQSELLALRWSDLDWQKRTITIQRQLARKNRQSGYFVPLKTKSAHRTIDVGQKTISKLRAHYERQHQERVSAKCWEENDLIFPSSRGTPQDQFNIYHKFKTIIKAAGLPDITFHCLRHTAASLMIAHKVPINVVSKRLGHSRVSITLDTYIHRISEAQRDAAELLDNLVFSVESELHPNCTDVPELENIQIQVPPYMEKSP
jgi:integrase